LRGDDNQQEGIFSCVSPEKRVPADHPLRPIRKMVDEILKEMSPRFAQLYSDVGRPSIAPERLFRSLLLQIFYSVRSEPMLIEQLQYNLLYRWFVGMEMHEAVWNHAVYSKNRERLLNEEVAETFFQRVLDRARPFMSDEHFTVDGTLREARASHKSFRPKDGMGQPLGPRGDLDFKGEDSRDAVNARGLDGFFERHGRQNGGNAFGEHRLASAGAPINKILWLPTQATSRARFAESWPRTSRRSTEYWLASASICEVPTVTG
jgi:transposase